MSAEYPGSDVSRIVPRVWRDIRLSFSHFLLYDILFKVAAAAVLAPLLTWVFTRLISTTGRLSLTNSQILSFALSPIGLVTVVLAVGVTLALVFAEEAGLVFMSGKTMLRARVSTLEALWYTLRRAPSLFGLGGLYAVLFGIALAPFVALAALAYSLLLTGHDINYFIAERPAAFWAAVAIGAALLAGAAVVFVTLYLRWVFAVPALLFEGVGPVAALRSSRRLISGHSLRVGGVLVGWGLVMAGSPVIVTFAFDWIGELVFARLGANLNAVIVALTLLVTAYVLAIEVVTFVGMAVNALLLTHLFADLRSRKGLPALALPSAGRRDGPVAGSAWRRPRSVFAAAALILAIVTAASTLAAVRSLGVEQRVEVTAHRGSSGRAPENSLSAIEAAIEDGADYAEIDVQETADGVVVLLHDEDLMRVAGVNRKIWDITYAELRDVDAGSWFSAEYAGERIPKLEEAIDLARGRIKLNIELKFNGHDRMLVERVVEIIDERDFASDALVSSLDLDGVLKARDLHPPLKIGYMVYQSAGDVTDLEVDVLSFNVRRVNADLVASAQRAGKELHVWTVDDPQQMWSFIDLGVDNIITNQPATLRAVLEERESLSDVEKLLLAFRDLLRR